MEFIIVLLIVALMLTVWCGLLFIFLHKYNKDFITNKNKKQIKLVDILFTLGIVIFTIIISIAIVLIFTVYY